MLSIVTYDDMLASCSQSSYCVFVAKSDCMLNRKWPTIQRASLACLFQNERNFNRFSAWLGKNSSTNKNSRILSELQSHMLVSGNCSASRYNRAASVCTPLQSSNHLLCFRYIGIDC